MSLLRPISSVLGAALVAGGALVAVPAAAVATPAPTPSGPSVSVGTCLPEGSGIGNGELMPIDSNVNVYVGGNFDRTKGAESEGLLVVTGDANFPTSRDGDGYNIGVAGGRFAPVAATHERHAPGRGQSER